MSGGTRSPHVHTSEQQSAPPDRDHHGGLPGPLLLTPEEAAKVLRIGRTRLYALLADGSIGSVRIGHSRWIAVRALQDFVGLLDDRPPSQSSYDPDESPASPHPVSVRPQDDLRPPWRSRRRTTPTAGAVEVLSLPFPVGQLEEP